MKTKYSWPAGMACALLIAIIITITCICNKIDGYKREMARLYNYHTTVQHRQQEDLETLFKRLNYLESKQQNMTETVDRLDWLSTHRY